VADGEALDFDVPAPGVLESLDDAVRIADRMGDQERGELDLRKLAVLIQIRLRIIREDIFAMYDEIAAEVVSGLRMTLLGELPTLQQTDVRAVPAGALRWCLG